jgi:hypothetical protein
MDKFYDAFKKNLENRPEPEFDGSAWKRLQKKMHDNPGSEKKKNGWVLPFLIGALVSSVLLNGYLIFKSNGHQTVSIVEKTIIDTVYITKEIVERDTVYLTKYVAGTNYNYRYVANSDVSGEKQSNSVDRKEPLQSNLSNRSRQEDSKQGEMANGTGNPNENNTLNPISTTPNVDQNETALRDANELTDAEMANLLPLLPLEEISFQTSGLKTELVMIRKDREEKHINSVQEILDKTSFHLGGGYLAALNEGAKNQFGLTAEFEAALPITNSFAVTTGLQYYWLRFTQETMGGESGIPFVNSPVQDFDFDHADVVQQLAEFKLGLNYHTSLFRKVGANAGIAYSITGLFPHKIEYNFYKEDEGISAGVDYAEKNYAFNYSNLNFSVGLDYPLSNSLNAFWGLNYRYNFQQPNSFTPFKFNSKLGLSFRF